MHSTSVRATLAAALFFVTAASAMAQAMPLTSVEVQKYPGDIPCGQEKLFVKRTYAGASSAQVIFKFEGAKANEVVGQNRALIDPNATGKPTAESAATGNGPGFLFHFDAATWKDVQPCFGNAKVIEPPPTPPTK